VARYRVDFTFKLLIIIIIIIIIITEGKTNIIALKFPRQCPLVLTVKSGKALGSEEGGMMGTGLLGIGSSGKKQSIWVEFCCLEGSIMTEV